MIWILKFQILLANKSDLKFYVFPDTWNMYVAQKRVSWRISDRNAGRRWRNQWRTVWMLACLPQASFGKPSVSVLLVKDLMRAANMSVQLSVDYWTSVQLGKWSEKRRAPANYRHLRGLELFIRGLLWKGRICVWEGKARNQGWFLTLAQSNTEMLQTTKIVSTTSCWTTPSSPKFHFYRQYSQQTPSP